MFCFGLIFVTFSALRSATAAHRKGWSGLLFGMIHGLVVTASGGAGVLMGLLIGLHRDPFLDRQTAAMPTLYGAGGGFAFGIILMMIVVGLLPNEREKTGQNGRFRPLDPEDVPE